MNINQESHQELKTNFNNFLHYIQEKVIEINKLKPSDMVSESQKVIKFSKSFCEIILKMNDQAFGIQEIFKTCSDTINALLFIIENSQNQGGQSSEILRDEIKKLISENEKLKTQNKINSNEDKGKKKEREKIIEGYKNEIRQLTLAKVELTKLCKQQEEAVQNLCQQVEYTESEYNKLEEYAIKLKEKYKKQKSKKKSLEDLLKGKSTVIDPNLRKNSEAKKNLEIKRKELNKTVLEVGKNKIKIPKLDFSILKQRPKTRLMNYAEEVKCAESKEDESSKINSSMDLDKGKLDSSFEREGEKLELNENKEAGKKETKKPLGIMDFNDEFYSKVNEFCKSWRDLAIKEKRF